MKTILMTGAAGGIGTYLRQEFKGKYALRLSDREPIDTLGEEESFVQADLSDLDTYRIRCLRARAKVRHDPTSRYHRILRFVCDASRHRRGSIPDGGFVFGFLGLGCRFRRIRRLLCHEGRHLINIRLRLLCRNCRCLDSRFFIFGRFFLPIAAAAILPLILLLLAASFRFLALCGKDAVVVFRVLEEILCRNPVTGRTRVAGHGEIFLVHLERVAANSDAGAVTVECLVAGRTVTSVRIPTARAFRAVVLSHDFRLCPSNSPSQ